MKEVQESPAAELVEKGGVPATEIGKYPGEITFTLPDSGKRIRMRKPLLADSIEVSNDPAVKNGVQGTLALMAQICLIDGQRLNWGDWASPEKGFSLVDYNFITAKYTDEITEPGK